MLETLLEAIAATPPATFLRRSFLAYPLVNALHVLGAGGLVVLVWLMHRAELRRSLSGEAAATGERPGFYRRFAALAIVLMVATGLALFSVRPTEYAANPAFRIKLVLIVLALVNVALYHARPAAQPVARWVSILIWPAILLAGRFIGFV